MPEVATQENPTATGTPGAAGAIVPAGDASTLSGAHRALLFLLSIDEQIATQVMSYMSEDDLRALRRAGEDLQEVRLETIAAVHRDFYERAQKGVPQSMKGSTQYLKRLAGRALGDAKVADLWQEKTQSAVAALAKLDVGTVVALLEAEQPQTVAVVLSELDPAKAAEIIKWLPAEKQSEVVLRMTKLTSVPVAVIQEIEQHFRQEIDALGSNEKRPIEGLTAAANLLKRLPTEMSDTLLEQLATSDQTLATDLRRQLFTFEDLIRIEGRGMQVFLQEVATPQLVLALKTASDELKDKVFSNVSSRAAAMLRDELEMLGPVRVADVETAQRAAVEIALNLEKEGRITITREGGGDFV